LVNGHYEHDYYWWVLMENGYHQYLDDDEMMVNQMVMQTWIDPMVQVHHDEHLL
jgi:hypothetical protein